MPEERSGTGKSARASASTVSAAMFWGEDDFLLRDAARALLTGRAMRADEIDGREWQGGETADLATPSLFGDPRALLVVGCQGLPEAGVRELKGYLAAPAPDAVCVLTQVSRGKGPPPLGKVVQAGGGLVRHVALKRQDLPAWVVERARGKDVRLSGPAAAALIATLGEDAATLDQAVEQLRIAFAGATVGPDEVRAQFQGLGEQKVWDLCDRAFAGMLSEALVILRSLRADREDPLIILGGIASRVRDLIRVRALSDRMPAVEAARAAGLRFDWQVRRYREQASRFSPDDLVRLHARVAESDRALKGGVADDLVLIELVTAMAGQLAEVRLPDRITR